MLFRICPLESSFETVNSVDLLEQTDTCTARHALLTSWHLNQHWVNTRWAAVFIRRLWKPVLQLFWITRINTIFHTFPSRTMMQDILTSVKPNRHKTSNEWGKSSVFRNIKVRRSPAYRSSRTPIYDIECIVSLLLFFAIFSWIVCV